jgi:acyl phosphate:glycerol-3-phosphate acyltransferase
MPSNYLQLIITIYLLGAIPFGFLMGRLNGIDIRQKGSGNIGATNVFRVLGKSWGIACFFLDFAKGFLAAGVVPSLILGEEVVAAHPTLPLLAGAVAILGHNWPVWLHFKGGKGIATSAGVIAAVAPLSLLSGLALWLVCMLLTRIVSVSSITAALGVAVSGWIFYGGSPVVAGILTALGVVAILRHRANIRRLLKGEEPRFGRKK